MAWTPRRACRRLFGAAEMLPPSERRPAERRVIACLVLDVVGSTDLVARLGPDRMKSELDRVFAEARKLVQSNGGIVEKFLGDGFLAVFGVPTTHADDSERALRAALDCAGMVERRRAEGTGLQARLSVEAGEAMVDTGVQRADGEHGLVGMCVNVAARLQEKAGSGQILVGPACHEVTSEIAEFETVGSFNLKGVGEVPAWRLVRLLEAHATLRPPFVGRVPDFARLVWAYERAEGGRPTFAIFVGPPGQGKTRLLEEFVGYLRDRVTLLSARCRPDDEAGRENPLRQLLRTNGSAVSKETLGERLANLIADPVERQRAQDALVHSAGVEVVPKLLTFRIAAREAEFLRGWRAYLSALSQGRTTLLSVEDLHWADPSILRLIDRLTEAGDDRLLVVATARPQLVGAADLRPGPNHFVFELRPLDAEATAKLARSVGAPVDEGLERAQGNPLFVLELARSPVDRGPLPMTIQAAIGAHIDELGPEDRSLLGRASVVGETFDVRDVALLAERGPADVAGALARLAHLRYVVRTDDGRYRFHHRLVRDVVYGRLGAEERLRLHAQYAREGTRPEEVESSAHHWWQAMGVPEAEWVWRDNPDRSGQRLDAFRAELGAAQRHLERAASDRALEVAGRAGRLAEGPEEAGKAHELLAQIRRLRGEGDEAWREWKEVLEAYRRVGLSPPARAYTQMIQLPVWIWGTFRHLPTAEEVTGLIDEGIEVARTSGDPVALADLLVNRVGFAGGASGVAEAVAAAESSSDVSGLGNVLIQLATVQSLQGELDSALATCARVDALFQRGAEVDEHEMLLWRFGALYHAGELERAEQLATRAHTLAAGQNVHYKSHTLGMLSHVRAARGKWAELRKLGEETEDLVRDNPAVGFCLIGAQAAGWGAVGALAQGAEPPGWLERVVQRMVPESPAVRASILFLPSSMTGVDRFRDEARPAYLGAPDMWHRQIWDQFGVNLCVGLTILEQWDHLSEYLQLLERVGSRGGHLLTAVRDAILEEEAHRSGGPRPRHEALRRLGYDGLSQLLSYRPRAAQ